MATPPRCTSSKTPWESFTQIVPRHRKRIVPLQRRIAASIIVTTLGSRPCTQKSRQNQSATIVFHIKPFIASLHFHLPPVVPG